MTPVSPTRFVRCWMLVAALAAAAGCGPSAAEPDGPPPSQATSAINVPLSCPNGVALCSGVGQAVSRWVPVSGSELQRLDAAQTFRVSAPGWPALARLVLRRTAAMPPGTHPRLQLEVRRTWGGWLNDRPLAGGLLSVDELPCTDDGAGGVSAQSATASAVVLP